MENINIDDLSPLALAYLGDTLFDLFLREPLVLNKSLSTHQMHIQASSYARAASQAKMVQLLLDELSDEEKEVVRHARNHKALTVPKNASPVDYKWATAFEALLGYLYLKDAKERVWELCARAKELLDRYKEQV